MSDEKPSFYFIGPEGSWEGDSFADLREKSRADRIKRAASAKANWLDDVIGGLLINGVTTDEIHVLEFPDRTVIQVRDEPRYEFKLTFKGP